MSFEDKIRESIWGRRLGIQHLSTVESGGSRGGKDYLVGPEAVRAAVTTTESTSVNIHPFGVSQLSTESSGVHEIDPPVPGVSKVIVNSSDSTSFLYAGSGQNFALASGSSYTHIRFINRTAVQLMGVTTALWAVVGAPTTGGFTVSTST